MPGHQPPCHSRLVATGKRVLHHCPIRRYTVLVLMPSVGVLRQSNRANNSGQLYKLVAFSALPLDCGYLSDDVSWSKPQVHPKTENSAEESWAPLPVTRTSGMPNLAKAALRSFMMGLEVIKVIHATKLYYVTMTRRDMGWDVWVAAISSSQSETGTNSYCPLKTSLPWGVSSSRMSK